MTADRFTRPRACGFCETVIAAGDVVYLVTRAQIPHCGPCAARLGVDPLPTAPDPLPLRIVAPRRSRRGWQPVPRTLSEIVR